MYLSNCIGVLHVSLVVENSEGIFTCELLFFVFVFPFSLYFYYFFLTIFFSFLFLVGRQKIEKKK